MKSEAEILREMADSLEQVNEEYSDAVQVNDRVTVDIQDDGEDGNRAYDVPTIALIVDGETVVKLAWEDAYNLAKAVKRVTDVANYGE